MGNKHSWHGSQISQPEIIKPPENTKLIKLFKFYDPSDVKIISILSQSAKGTAYAVEQHEQQLCAKYFASQEEFEHELFIYSLLHQKEYPAITKIIGVSKMDRNYAILLELLPMGSLENYTVKKNNRLSLKDTLQILIDVMEGLCFLHSNDIIYRDLALRNILLYEDIDNNGIRAKITDFGWSQQKSAKLSAIHGPYRILAPESIKDVIFSEKSDVWSFGIFIYSLLTYQRPYADIEKPLQVKEAIESGRRLTIESTVFDTTESNNMNQRDHMVVKELVLLFKEIHVDDAEQRPDPRSILERLQRLKSEDE